MPVVDENPHLSHLLTRSDSLRSNERSEISDLGSDKRVSFNNDVRIKRIPNKSKGFKDLNVEAKVTHEAVDPEDVEAETKQILQQLEGIKCSVSSGVPNSEKKPDNRLYGLHALNNLDIAVNGKEVNSMPSYQEIRRNSLVQNSSDSNSSYPKTTGETPPKPPRRNMTHYAQPAISGLQSDLESISSDMRSHRKRLQEAFNNEDSAIASGGDADDSTVTSSYTSRFIRKSPPRHKMSPSRTCMTDSEILRSPTEVLYAVSEKHKHRNNELMNSTSSQTNLDHHGQRPPSRAYATASRPRSTYTYSSREDLGSNDDGYMMSSNRRSISENNRYARPKNHVKAPSHHSSRSLDRLQHDLEEYEANKENTFKTRIQVISPDRQHMIQNGGHNRKPYKTTINTATDNILYRGNSTDNLSYYHYGDRGDHRGDGGHYKIPKSRPVNPATRNNGMGYDNGSPYRNSLQRPQSSFQSTRLIKNMDSTGPRGRTYIDRDRGMMIRNRNYSGHSTSPDRDISPDRSYRQPRAPPRAYLHQRSPSTSPTRPPRSRSSPTRESAMVRRTNSRRDTIDRSPSVMTSNGLRERSRESNGRRSSYVSPNEASDRLSKFIEYRGEDIIMPHAQDPNQQPRRASNLTDRERGQSLPPGATIENVRDFYKSSQYKSMYQLPPSPTRPAPVLDRGGSGNERGGRTSRMSPSAGPRVSISEGDVTDEGGQRPPPEKMPRHHRRPVSTSALRPGSSKRQAPSPPVAPSTGKGLVVRRVVSSDGRVTNTRGGGINSNVQKAPSMRRIVVGTRRSSVDNGLDSSFSESEGFNGETDQDKQPMGDFGRRWAATNSATPHSDIDSDYRRELATSGVNLHQEARSRDGGVSWAGPTGRLSRGSSKTNIRTLNDEPDVILRSPSTTDLERSNSNSAREEERRKVLEIEGVIRQPQSGLRANVSRSASRASRTAHVTNAGPRGYKPGVPRHLSADLDGRESQYSGHSSSQTMPVPGPTSKLNRFDQHRVGVGRVRRSTSNANAAAIGGVRREINQRKTKLPGGSLTSSVNSSESEQGSHAGQSAVSRNTARSNRSVFLHAAAVADIPSPPDAIRIPPTRSLSAESRDNLAVNSGTINAQTRPPQPPPPTNSNLKGSKKISRSISLLAPWKPRPVQDKFEIHYDNGNLYSNPATRVTVEPGNMPAASKPPRPPTAPPPPPTGGPPSVRRNPSRIDPKSASSSDLLRDENTTPAVILAERKAAAEAEKKANKVSRSVSMPKDSRLAGWFKKRKRVA